ncbi:MAG: deoxyribose-phosphate aldolase [Desulfurococcaceae archaeon]
MENQISFPKLTAKELASMIDHTLLKPDADYKLLEKYIDDTKRYGFKLLIIPLSLVEKALEISGKTIDIGTVIGFPLGNTSINVKVAEAIEAAELGVAEIDMVMNINLFKSREYDKVLEEIRRIVSESRRRGVRTIKVIIETGLLSDDEKAAATEIVAKSGADYVKTCTGFLGSVATIHDVYLLNRVAKGRVRIKAAGGIRHAVDALTMIMAGASRIGTSTGNVIIDEFQQLEKAFDI